MKAICCALSFLFAIAVLAQPGTVRVDIEPVTVAWSSR